MGVAVPPDGVILRRYADTEEGLTEGGRRYLFSCLLKGIRTEPMPDPRPDHKVSSADRAIIQAKAHSFLPDIERVRAGEMTLGQVRAGAPVQPPLGLFEQ